jgi:hypothetical protein
MQDFEKLGAFYLGRVYDLAAKKRTDDLLLYDARDLTTHAVCVGMTGSGKTGLCLGLLEEAAIDGIPAIAIDPKGDLGNLLLTFPELRPADFRPWIDEGEAQRKGQTPDDYAAATAETWKKGLADWGQDAARIARLRGAAEMAIYTPGSRAGRPLRVLRSFAAPPAALLADDEALRERVAGAVSGTLALLGIEADPVKSREHILLSTLLERAWREGRDLEIGQLIQEVQTPPFTSVGVMDLEAFFPAKDRFALAMAVNNLLASPGFAAWMEGEPLDVGRLLWTPEGKPRIAIVSIAHLSESERMFLVTLLLSEVVAWVRAQPGTTSLRALLYMDEVFGYLPPSANPPSKTPMLTLLKQARAQGLGVVLATQNPVDVDYKALANAGTWFVGRLQTERDKARLLDGLEGASATAGKPIDRAQMDATLSALGQRVFLMHDVHEDGPVTFQTRWTLSYLRGPLTRAQIQTLTGASPPAAAPATPTAPAPAAAPRPVLPPGIPECFVASRERGGAVTYQPQLLATAKVHFVNAGADVDTWKTMSFLADVPDDAGTIPWEQAEALADGEPGVGDATAGASFAELPPPAARAASYAVWQKQLVTWLTQEHPITVWRCKALDQISRPEESQGEFRGRLALSAREARDDDKEKLRKKYAPKLAALEERKRVAAQRVAREQSDYGQKKIDTALSIGATVLGALFGRKRASATTVGRATTAARSVGRAAKEREDVQRAEENVAAVDAKIEELNAELAAEIASLDAGADPASLALDEVTIRPKKADVTVTRLALAWTPWRTAADGTIARGY